MAVTQPALSAAQVAHISELLAQIDFPALLATLPTNDTQAVSLIGNGADQIVGGPRTYLLQHFNALGEFYRRAAQRHLLLVLWWDRHRARPPRLLTQHPKNYVNFRLGPVCCAGAEKAKGGAEVVRQVVDRRQHL